MPVLSVAAVLSLLADSAIETYMQHAFYPVLLGLLLIASLGVPIPEDIPLIAAGVLLRTHPDIASWEATMVVALVGIMAGDLILYRMGHTWGPGVVNHRFVRWLITPKLFRKASQKFSRYGMWYCFFGRFLMGVRAVMCMTAGATRFPYWRFFLADLAGALLSVPFFMYLGYWFTGMIPTLRTYTVTVQGVLTVSAGVIVAAMVYYKIRRIRKRQQARATSRAHHAEPPVPAPPTQSPASAPPSPGPVETEAALNPKEPPIRAEMDE